nr:integrase, catalytic region, zinc finger, CCHC-type, peptidase aspartic, catalytic [Tanacetum cinerariifolium]
MHFLKALLFGLVSMYLKNRNRHCGYHPVASISGRSLEPAAIIPYKPTTVVVQAVAATDDSSVILEHTIVEIPMNIRLLMLAKQLRKCGKLSKGYNKPEWSRFVTIVNQQHKLDEVSYYKPFDILKQYQKEVNELRAKRLARNANPLALVATAQANQDPYYQTSKSQKSYAPSSKPSIPTRTHTTTRYKGKEIAKPITPPSESASEEDNDPEQAQRDKDMQKNLVLITKYFKKIYKPTNNNLRTSSNSRNKNVDTTPWNAESQKRLKTLHMDEEIDEQELEAHYNYMAKIHEVPTADTCADSEPLQQVQNDTRYNVFANDLQHSEKSESISNTCIVETDDSNVIPDSLDMCEDDIHNDQNDVESDDERVTLANLIANLKLDVDENKKIQKQLKKANTTLAQELKECKTILAETSKTLKESNSVRDSFLVALQNKQTEFEKYKAFNDRTIDYDKLQQDQFRVPTAQDMDIPVKTCLMPLSLNTQNDSFIFVHELKQEMHADLKYVESLKKEIDELEFDKAEFSNMYDMILQEIWNEQASNVFRKEREQYIEIQDLKAQDKNISISELKKLIQKCKGKSVETKFDKPSVVRQPNAQRIPKPSVLGVNHKTNVSRAQLRSNKMKYKVVPNNSQVKLKKTQVEDHPRIPSISNKNKSVTACNDSLNSRTSNANAVCATCGKCLVDSDHFACVTKMLNDHMTSNLKLLCNFVKKFLGTVRFGNDQFASILGYGDLVQDYITINRVYYIEGLNHNLFSIGQFCDADLEVAFWKSTCFVRDHQGNDLLTSNRGSDLYKISLQALTSSTLLYLMAKALPTQAWLWHRRLSHLNFD